MKKIFISFFVCSIVLGSAVAISFAEKSEKEMAQEERSVVRAEALQRIGVSKTKSTPLPKTDERMERIIAQGEKMHQRLNAAIDRLEKIAHRLDARIMKLEKAGITLPESKILLSKTRVEILEAKSVSSAVVTTINQIKNNAVAPRVAFEQIKKALKDTETKIKSAHKTLVLAIASVKASDTSVATSTPANQ